MRGCGLSLGAPALGQARERYGGSLARRLV